MPNNQTNEDSKLIDRDREVDEILEESKYLLDQEKMELTAQKYRAKQPVAEIFSNADKKPRLENSNPLDVDKEQTVNENEISGDKTATTLQAELVLEGTDDDYPSPQNEILKETEKEFERALRPLNFGDFQGQKKIVENLEIFVRAAKMRGESLDHVILHGPPGLGKTTLSAIIANELGVGIKITSGPVLDKPGDLAGLLTNLEENDVLFIDEIHRLSPVVEEYLYSAMEDYRIDIMIDKGPSARSIQIDLNPFTLVGATTRSGLLTAPLRARFGINLHLEYYDDDILSNIIRRSASILDVPCSVRAASEIASRSRGTPRIANALLRRVRDFAQVKGSGSIDTEIAQFALEALNIDKYGLDEIDNKILCTIIDKFKGGPVGLTTIATALGEDAGTIEEVYEPVSYTHLRAHET